MKLKNLKSNAPTTSLCLGFYIFVLGLILTLLKDSSPRILRMKRKETQKSPKRFFYKEDLKSHCLLGFRHSYLCKSCS